MRLIDIMHMTAAQMGKLYVGSGLITSTNPMKLIDGIIRINDGDHVGGTLFLADQSYTIKDTNVNGEYTLIRPMVASYTDPFPTQGQSFNYTMTDMDRSTLVNAINTALLAMGEHTTYQDLDVVATDYREFILPEGMYAPLKLEFFSYTNQTYGFSFANTNSWDLSIKDGKNVITFRNRIIPDEAAKIRVWYNTPHGRISRDADLIDPDYHTRRLVYESAYWGYFQFLAREQNSSDRDLLMYQSIMQERMNMANKHPVPRLLHRITLPRN